MRFDTVMARWNIEEYCYFFEAMKRARQANFRSEAFPPRRRKFAETVIEPLLNRFNKRLLLLT